MQHLFIITVLLCLFFLHHMHQKTSGEEDFFFSIFHISLLFLLLEVEGSRLRVYSISFGGLLQEELPHLPFVVIIQLCAVFEGGTPF